MRESHKERNKISWLLEEGMEEGVFPGAVLLVAHRGEVVFFQEFGYRSLIPYEQPMTKDTIFDLASLTKPLATTLTLMKLVDEGKIGLDQPFSGLVKEVSLRDKEGLTPRLLLAHSAGLADWKPYYLKLVDYPLNERKKALRGWIIEEPFAYKPGEGSLYSDLGFMLLEWIVEARAGEGLWEFVQKHFYAPLGLERTFFLETSENPPQSPFTKGGRVGVALTKGGRAGGSFAKGEKRGAAFTRRGGYPFAATEDCPWRKRVIQGEVHDENAWALGGYSGHAGLFGTAAEVHGIVNMLRQHYFGKGSDLFRTETVREFFRRQDIVKGSDWALGWDTPSQENSSSGKYFSRNSVGHTGFTGTSVWMDLDKDVVVIFLTNRVHPTRMNEKIKAFRPRLHDLIMEELSP